MDYKSAMDRDFREAIRLRDAEIQYCEREKKTSNNMLGLALIITFALCAYEYSFETALSACTIGVIGYSFGYVRCKLDREHNTKDSAFVYALREYKKSHPERFDEFGWYHYDGFNKFFAELT